MRPAVAVSIEAVAWADPDAHRLRREMFDDLVPLYPVEPATVVDHDAFDARHARGVVAMYLARVDGAPAGCAALRAEVGGEVPGTGEVRLYERTGWSRIAAFGPNEDDGSSAFFGKDLVPTA